jgi:hypothetical protein
MRRGRIERKVAFGVASKDTIAQLFCIVLKHSGDVTDEGVQVENDDTVEKLATDFANKAPELEVSPAEIISFLLENRQMAIAGHSSGECAAVDNQNQGGREGSEESIFLSISLGAQCVNLLGNSSLI